MKEEHSQKRTGGIRWPRCTWWWFARYLLQHGDVREGGEKTSNGGSSDSTKFVTGQTGREKRIQQMQRFIPLHLNYVT